MQGLSRRRFIGLGAVAAGGAALGLPRAAESAASTAPGAVPNRFVPFDGLRQAGVTTPQQTHAIFAIYDIALERRGELRELLSTVTTHARELCRGRLEPPSDQHAPPPDSGVLGSGGDPANLTITLGLGLGPFRRAGDPFGIADRQPSRLKQMPSFPGDDLDPRQTDGDLLLQICADDPIVTHHALRELERATRGALTPRVLQRGAQRIAAVDPSKGEVAGARGLLGFKDGTANPRGSDADLMNSLVWLQGTERGEPAWTRDGTYLVLRKIRDRLEAWDRETLRSQERLVGRRRDSGAPLDGERESDEPNYDADPEGKVTPLDAHIRRANPRLPGTERQRILRRGYPYHDGYDSTGLLDAGLLFAAFQRDPVAQFEAVKQRLSPRGARPQGLDEYLTCVGGGYFFCPHGASNENHFVGERLFGFR